MKPLQWIIASAAYIGHLGRSLLTLLSALAPPIYMREWARCTAELGLKCLPPVVLVQAAFGVVVSVQGLFILDIFTAQQFLGSLIVSAFQKELAPVLTGIILSVQAGSIICAEIGTMRLREQVDALEVMAVDPVRFLYLPRLMAMLVIAPCLTLLGGVVAVWSGGAVLMSMHHMGYGTFANLMFDWLTMTDALWAAILKALTFGLVTGLIAIHQGVTATGGTLGIGQATNRAVVHSIIGLFFFNNLWTNFLFGGLI